MQAALSTRKFVFFFGKIRIYIIKFPNSFQSKFEFRRNNMSSKLAATTVIFICLLDYFQAVMVNIVDDFRPSQKLPNIFPNNIQKSRAIEYATRHDNSPIFNTRGIIIYFFDGRYYNLVMTITDLFLLQCFNGIYP